MINFTYCKVLYVQSWFLRRTDKQSLSIYNNWDTYYHLIHILEGVVFWDKEQHTLAPALTLRWKIKRLNESSDIILHDIIKSRMYCKIPILVKIGITEYIEESKIEGKCTYCTLHDEPVSLLHHFHTKQLSKNMGYYMFYHLYHIEDSMAIGKKVGTLVLR